MITWKNWLFLALIVVAFGLLLLLTGLMMADSRAAEGAASLQANAGPDQTVPGPSPVPVQFDGSGSVGDIVSYQWYNQWGHLRAEGGAPLIEVNFGHESPPPGAKRTFTLVIEDSQGNTTQDQVTIVLGETPQPCVSPIKGDCLGVITFGNGSKMHYYRNFPFNTPNSGITSAILVIHGHDRNPLHTFYSMITAAQSARSESNSLIVVPHFKTSDDKPESNHLYWTSAGWKDGSRSVASPRTSSFTAIDNIIAILNREGRFPNLREIVIVGHSAGGQFVNRYAAVGQAENSFKRYSFRYIVSNPSNYLYLNEYRADFTDISYSTWYIPSTSCDYNSYKHGLKNIRDWGYMQSLSDSAVIQQYASRDVIYLMGEADTDTNSPNVENGCRDALQGRQRYERAQVFYNFMEKYFPSNQHSFFSIPGVGHSQHDVYNSKQGIEAIF